ncbi:MAG: VWA domain-containing protein, partial [Planctomycetes bacterium]|nr:VWA domain-containing protein [Planctomycetota bacterium]
MFPILSAFDSLSFPEFIYIIPIAIVFVIVLFVSKKKKRIPLDYCLYGIKTVLIILFLIVLSLPQKNANDNVRKFAKRNHSLVYIELAGNTSNTLSKIEEITEKLINVEYIVRYNGKIRNYIENERKRLLEDIAKYIFESSAKDRSYLKLFQKLEMDLNDYKKINKMKKLLLIGAEAPDNEIIKTISKKSINIEFVAFEKYVSKEITHIINFSISPDKIIIGEPFTIIIEFNKMPDDFELANFKIIMDGKSKSVNSPINKVNLFEFDGFQKSGTHEIIIEMGNKSITSKVFVYAAPKIFIIEGDSKSEQNADELLMKLSKMSLIKAVKLKQFPDKIHFYNTGIVRLSQILLLNEIDKKRIIEWIKNGASLFISYGQDIQLIQEQIAKFKDILPAEPVLIREPENLENKAVDDLDKDRLLARVTLLLMIDNSGSMAANIGGVSRFEYVKAAAKKAVEGLSPEDFISICSFNKDVTVILPPVPAQNKELIYRKLEQIEHPGWQTSLRQACESAVDILRNDKSAVKQLIILSDGEETVEPKHDFTKSLKKLIDANINTTVIGFGEYNPEMLRRLVTKGGIAYFQSREKDDKGFYIHKLPNLILTDVKMAKDTLKKMFNGDTEENDIKIEKNKATMQVVKTGSFNSFMVYNPFVDWTQETEKVYRFVEMYNYPNCY